MKISAVICQQTQNLILKELLNNENGNFELTKIYHHGPQHWPPPRLSRRFCSSDGLNLRWRKQFHRTRTAALANLQLFRCK